MNSTRSGITELEARERLLADGPNVLSGNGRRSLVAVFIAIVASGILAGGFLFNLLFS